MKILPFFFTKEYFEGEHQCCWLRCERNIIKNNTILAFRQSSFYLRERATLFTVCRKVSESSTAVCLATHKQWTSTEFYLGAKSTNKSKYYLLCFDIWNLHYANQQDINSLCLMFDVEEVIKIFIESSCCHWIWHRWEHWRWTRSSSRQGRRIKLWSWYASLNPQLFVLTSLLTWMYVSM